MTEELRARVINMELPGSQVLSKVTSPPRRRENKKEQESRSLPGASNEEPAEGEAENSIWMAQGVGAGVTGQSLIRSPEATLLPPALWCLRIGRRQGRAAERKAEAPACLLLISDSTRQAEGIQTEI